MELEPDSGIPYLENQLQNIPVRPKGLDTLQECDSDEFASRDGKCFKDITKKN